MNEELFETMEDIQNHLRQHEGKVTGKELQPALEMLKAHFEKKIEITSEDKEAFDMLFEKLAYNDNGKGKYPALAFLLAAIEFYKNGRIETLKKIREYATTLVKELTPRMWEYQEIALSPLQRINNACRDSESFLNTKLVKTYEYEIQASRLNDRDKNLLLEYVKKISGK